MMDVVSAKILLLVVLGPVAAFYDLCTNPAAPPQIFVAQFTDAFGHPPGANLPIAPRPKVVRFKKVYVTHG